MVLVDDHVLLRNGLASTVQSFDRFDVLFQASNGTEMIEMLNPSNLPDLVLMDVNMPEMDGLCSSQLAEKKLPGYSYTGAFHV